MGRPKNITDEELLAVARKLFLERGYSVSTATIAREAEISEGTLFKRFPTKAELFRAALGFPGFNIKEMYSAFEKAGEVREGLVSAFVVLLRFQAVLVPRLMRLWAEPNVISLEEIKGDPDAPPFALIKEIAGFLDSLSQQEKLRIRDPELAAKVIVGATHNLVYLHFLLKEELKEEEIEEFSRKLVEFLWSGIAP